MAKKKESHKMPDGTEMTGKTHSKSSKPVSKASSKVVSTKGASPKGKSDWMVHLGKVYKEKKGKDPKYKYSEAMKDAKKTYKK